MLTPSVFIVVTPSVSARTSPGSLPIPTFQ